MKILTLILSLFITTIANADVASQALNKVSEKISNLIPGEGITEVSLDYNAVSYTHLTLPTTPYV